MESKSHCLGLFHPTEFLSLTFFRFSSRIPLQMHCGYVARYQKHMLAKQRRTKAL